MCYFCETHTCQWGGGTSCDINRMHAKVPNPNSNDCRKLWSVTNHDAHQRKSGADSSLSRKDKRDLSSASRFFNFTDLGVETNLLLVVFEVRGLGAFTKGRETGGFFPQDRVQNGIRFSNVCDHGQNESKDAGKDLHLKTEGVPPAISRTLTMSSTSGLPATSSGLLVDVCRELAPQMRSIWDASPFPIFVQVRSSEPHHSCGRLRFGLHRWSKSPASFWG